MSDMLRRDTAEGVTFYEFEMPAGHPGVGKVPKWLRMAAISDDGVIYAPGGIAGGENAVFLCAGYDGTQVLALGGHHYYPTAWLYQEFPTCRQSLENLERMITKAHA